MLGKVWFTQKNFVSGIIRLYVFNKNQGKHEGVGIALA